MIGAALVALALSLPATAADAPYRATSDDFAAVQDGIAGALRAAPSLFPNGIEQVDVTLYDAETLYIWSRAAYPYEKTGEWNGYSIYRTPHHGTPTEREMARCGGTPGFVLDAMHNRRQKFSCSPVGLQTAIQHRRGSIYDTRESYLGTIAHEYGHAYMWQELWQIADVTRLAPLVRKRGGDTLALQEAYAILCELRASKALYPGHYERLRKDFGRAGSLEPHQVGYEAAMELLGEQR